MLDSISLGREQRLARGFATMFFIAGTHLASGCMVSPSNGDTHRGNSRTEQRSWYGWTNDPWFPVADFQVRTNPGDPHSWLSVPEWAVNSAPDPNVPGSPPAFRWQINGSLESRGVPASAWPAGGVIAYRASGPLKNADNQQVYTDYAAFDHDSFACWLSKSSAGLNWIQAGVQCATPYPEPIARVLDITRNPALSATPPKFLIEKKNDALSAPQGANYYKTKGNRIPLTFAEFKTKYRFGTGGDEATATYYNYADLGLGRHMVCRTITPVSGSFGTACYVTNYAGARFGSPFGAKAETPENPEGLRDTALVDAVARTRDVATVVMVYDRTENDPIVFGAYNGSADPYKNPSFPAGARLDQAPLDNAKANVDIPSNCLTCHGGSAIANANGTIKDAQFLPFDLQNFRYSAAAQFTRAAQEESFRRLNVHVFRTTPLRISRDLIDGWYGGGLGTSGRTFNDAFVPPGWRNTDANGQPINTLFAPKLYAQVYRPFCQGCHIAQTSIDMSTYSKFASFSPRIVAQVCGTPSNTGGPSEQHKMPHAELTMKHFWESPARAHMLSGLSVAHGCGNTTAN